MKFNFYMFGWIDISAYCPQWICIITSLLNLPSTVLHTPVSVNCSGSNDNSKANLRKLISRMHKILRIYKHVVVNVPDVFVYSLKNTIIFITKIFFSFKLVCQNMETIYAKLWKKYIFYLISSVGSCSDLRHLATNLYVSLF